MKRILAAFMTCLFLLGNLPASGERENVSTDFYEGFILKQDLHYTMEADFGLFGSSSTSYNHELARLSFMLVTSAFKNETEDLQEKGKHLIRFFQDTGFECLRTYDYDVEPTKDTIANGIAVRRLSDAAGEYALVAVPVCGQGYGDEWVSNLTVGSNMEHTGFTDSASKVYARLMDYLAENLPGERVKLWVTGFSRAAAVGNVLAHLILSSGEFEPENVFVYTFGCPNTTKDPVTYPQVFNIVNGFDPVSKVPLAEWGYGKHGVTLTLPTFSTNENYAELATSAQKIFDALLDRTDEPITLTERNWLVVEILDMLYRYLPETETYAEGYQEALSRTWVEPGGVADKLNVFVETAKGHNCDTGGLDKIYDEFSGLAAGSLDYAAGVVLGREDDSTWADVFTSGGELAHEHFPVTYLAWMFSTDDTDLLFGSDSAFTRIAYSGSATPVVTRLKEGEKGDTVYDEETGGCDIPVVRLNGETHLDLPSDGSYEVILTAEEDTGLRIFCGAKELSNAGLAYSETGEFSLKRGESVGITVPAGADARHVQVLLNGTESLPLQDVGEENTIHKAGAEEKGDKDNLNYLISEFTSIVPELTGMLVLLVWGIFVLIRRMEEGPVDDSTGCPAVLKALFRIVAVLAMATAAYCVYKLFNLSVRTENSMENSVFLRVSEIVSLRVALYYAYALAVQAVMAVTAVRSVRHRRSRMRLGVFSVLIMLLDFAALFFTLSYDLFDTVYIFYQAVPVLALGTVIAAQIWTKKREKA